jgi:hypothetical protein
VAVAERQAGTARAHLFVGDFHHVVRTPETLG